MHQRNYIYWVNVLAKLIGNSGLKLQYTLFSGVALLFVSATLVNAGNYLFNLLLGRWLGPAIFADLSLIITLLLVISFITSGLQTPVARFVAICAADNNQQGIADMRGWSAKLAVWLGVGLFVLFGVGAPLWVRFFSAGSSAPFIIFGLFVPFYLLQGIERGVLQGRTRFGWLAITYQMEMWSRLLLSLVFVTFGLAVNGAVLGIGISFVMTWLIARHGCLDLPLSQPLSSQVRYQLLRYSGPVLVAQLGQILINNSDILIVRHFFPAEAAGYYAALALVGRIVFFATWSIVTAIFPIVTQHHHLRQPHRHLLYTSLAIVLVCSVIITTLMYFGSQQVVQILFGSAYLSIAPLLWLYALATMCYALGNVVINYWLAIDYTGGTYLAIGIGVVQVVSLWLFHATLSQVVWVQILLMVGLFLTLLVWDMARYFSIKTDQQAKSLGQLRNEDFIEP